MSCFKSDRQLRKEEIKNNGYVLMSEYTHDLALSKDEKSELLKAAKADGSILIYDRNVYIKSNYEFKEHKRGYYAANVICVLNALLKNYSYLKDIVLIEDGVAYIKNLEDSGVVFIKKSKVYYNNQKQRAYFDVDGKQVDMMSYLRDYINSEEESEKGNNTYDYCPNHLVSCFN